MGWLLSWSPSGLEITANNREELLSTSLCALDHLPCPILHPTTHPVPSQPTLQPSGTLCSRPAPVQQTGNCCCGQGLCTGMGHGHGRTSQGYEQPLPLCISPVVVTSLLLPLLLRAAGTFWAVFSCWRAGRGGATCKLLRIIDQKLTACPPPHPQTQHPGCC